jgi:hypothetical protein
MQPYVRAFKVIGLGPAFLVMAFAAASALAGAAAHQVDPQRVGDDTFDLTRADSCVWYFCEHHHYFGRFRFYGDHYTYYRGLGGIGYGLFLSRLPQDRSIVWRDGVPYQYADSTYYQWNDVERKFEAVRTPDAAGVLAFQAGGDYAR